MLEFVVIASLELVAAIGGHKGGDKGGDWLLVGSTMEREGRPVLRKREGVVDDGDDCRGGRVVICVFSMYYFMLYHLPPFFLQILYPSRLLTIVSLSL